MASSKGNTPPGKEKGYHLTHSCRNLLEYRQEMSMFFTGDQIFAVYQIMCLSTLPHSNAAPPSLLVAVTERKYHYVPDGLSPNIV